MTDTKTPESEANAEVNGDKLKGPDVASPAPVFGSVAEIDADNLNVATDDGHGQVLGRARTRGGGGVEGRRDLGHQHYPHRTHLTGPPSTAPKARG